MVVGWRGGGQKRIREGIVLVMPVAQFSSYWLLLWLLFIFCFFLKKRKRGVSEQRMCMKEQNAWRKNIGLVCWEKRREADCVK